MPGPRQTRRHQGNKLLLFPCQPWIALGLSLLLIGHHTRAEEPSYEFMWVKTILGPCCGDAGEDLAVDADGAVFIAGHRGGLDLDRDGSVDVQKYGGVWDSLVMKVVIPDNEKGWVMGPGSEQNDRASGVTSDRQGGAYAVGWFEETMNVASGEIHSAGRRDGFLVHYAEVDSEKNWAVPIGNVDNDYLYKVASDAAGNAYVIGTISGDVDIDRDGIVDVTAKGDSSMLLASFDPNGKLRWAHSSAGGAVEDGRAIMIGPHDEIYVAGFFRAGTLDLDADGEPNGSVASERSTHGYFARFDSAGKMLWERVISGADWQGVLSLAVTGNGDLLIHGGYNGPIDLDGDGTADVEFKSLGDSLPANLADMNAFLARFSTDGKLIWARRYTTGGHIAADATRIVMSGMYSGPLDLDGDGEPERAGDNDEEYEGFSAILDGHGEIQHVFTIVGGDSDVAHAAGFTPDGEHLYVTGYTKLGADFNDDGQIESASQCHQLGDVFLAMYDVGL